MELLSSERKAATIATWLWQNSELTADEAAEAIGRDAEMWGILAERLMLDAIGEATQRAVADKLRKMEAIQAARPLKGEDVVTVNVHYNMAKEDPICIEHNPSGVSSNPVPYFTVRLGFDCSVFMSHAQMAELRDTIDAALTANPLPEAVVA